MAKDDYYVIVYKIPCKAGKVQQFEEELQWISMDIRCCINQCCPRMITWQILRQHQAYSSFRIQEIYMDVFSFPDR